MTDNDVNMGAVALEVLAGLVHQNGGMMRLKADSLEGASGRTLALEFQPDEGIYIVIVKDEDDE